MNLSSITNVSVGSGFCVLDGTEVADMEENECCLCEETLALD